MARANDTNHRRWPDRMTFVVTLAALVWTAVVGALWLVAPAWQTFSAGTTTGGSTTVTSSTQTLLEVEGPSVLFVLAVPVALAALAVATGCSRRRRRIRLVTGGLLLMACLLGYMTIGLPYVPAAVALLVAGARTPGPVQPSADSPSAGAGSGAAATSPSP